VKVKHWRGAFGLAGGIGLALQNTLLVVPLLGGGKHKI
jgi:hypothetical protein